MSALYSLLLFSLFVTSFAVEQCDNNRACPDDYWCNESGTHCCNGVDCNIRSSWSLITSKCLSSDMVCHDYSICKKDGQNCTAKSIQVCDNYLKMDEKVQCGDGGFLIGSGFEMCNQIHEHHTGANPEGSVMWCTEKCVQEALSDRILSNKGTHSCHDIETQAHSNITNCFAECNGCYTPNSLSTILDLFSSNKISNLVVYSLSHRCADKIMLDEECNAESIAHKFVEIVHEKSGIDVSSFFAKLLTTTGAATEEYESEPEHHEESTTEEPTQETESPNYEAEVSTDTSFVSFGHLIALGALLVILNVIFLAAYYFATRNTQVYKIESEPVVRMNSLIVNDLV